MLPTLNGRLQLRVLVGLVVGGLWTAIVAPVLPTGASVSDNYRVAYVVLTVMIAIGVVWELIYHAIQQFRWEKDWPTLFTLLTGINEGVVLWLVLKFVMPDGYLPPTPAFVIQFVTTWLIVFFVLNGPLRIVFPRQRFRGGSFV
ncbi:hypothetical protein nbrc107696_38800 [Gordonia spumicola]|uniref:Uncharacterized protein n=1 Tax=Gordonia spumicola TaxID=589161 RepID=A0A7I9VDQ9_9ACTN|nr:hypothetical protein [Gordonia spumicola]GEE03434.1 hypothetical protein nbrc107696_38800 [Gordonia spumicola]